MQDVLYVEKLVAGSQIGGPNLHDNRVWTRALTATKMENEERRDKINES